MSSSTHLHQPQSNKGPRGAPVRVLVTTGPTREPIDDVRFIGNRSSGRMGAAIAQAFMDAGCHVTAAVGAGAVRPTATTLLDFGSTEELACLLQEQWPNHQLLVMAAAVADYTPVRTGAGKLRRSSGPLILELEPTPDLLASLARITRPHQMVVGFALEREEDLEASARAKLQRKQLDAIVANPLNTMDAENVRAKLLLADGDWLVPEHGAPMSKPQFAAWLAATLLPLVAQRTH